MAMRQGQKKFITKLLPLFKAMFVETNPIPVKAAVAAMGLLAEEYRLPLCPMADASRAKNDGGPQGHGHSLKRAESGTGKD